MENCYPISILQKKSFHPSTGIPKTFFWVNTTLNSLSHIYLTGTTISPTKILLCLFTEKHCPTNLYTMLHMNRVIVIHLIKFFGCKAPMITVSPSNHVQRQFSPVLMFTSLLHRSLNKYGAISVLTYPSITT